MRSGHQAKTMLEAKSRPLTRTRQASGSGSGLLASEARHEAPATSVRPRFRTSWHRQRRHEALPRAKSSAPMHSNAIAPAGAGPEWFEPGSLCAVQAQELLSGPAIRFGNKANASSAPLRVLPNPSLNRTRYGKRRKPGLRHMVHHLSPGLRRLPPRAG